VEVEMTFKISSSAFKTGEAIPTKYSCDGENVSPSLTWEGFPPNAQSLTLIVDDPDAPNGVFTHWVLFNIAPDKSGLPQDFAATNQNAVQGRNSYQHNRYDGPCPPGNETHTYHFHLFALDQYLDLPEGATRTQVVTEMQGHILAEAELTAPFSRQAASAGR
jgi:Raf kinase inhibitor-like YbhB/YbcL family protein